MLNIEKLSVAYGETLILRDVDMQVEPGQLVSLLGRNGVGKTTLLKSIIGLLQPRAGRIMFEGQDLTEATPDWESVLVGTMLLGRLWGPMLSKLPMFRRAVRPDERAHRGIAYVPQGREIFPALTVLENLKLGLLANPDQPKDIPEEVFGYFPALKTMLDRKGGFLSGGQQQQLAIARALVMSPKLLILDEPTEGIQPNIVELIGEVLTSLKKAGKVAILLVEQSVELAMELADSYYVMEKGAIALSGKSAETDQEAIKPYLAF